ncbi:MAG: FAD-dependent oxidoreductase, partial [Bacteroidales bacterium]|nr:FAD-dependent oxidoreductase [Bacteroidales bacterium]
MDRRDFLKKSALGCGAVALGNDALAQPRADFSVSTQRIETNEFVKEPAHKIPVLARTDVVVVGGGPAGVAAALSAARAGSNVWLIERYNHLGGLWTGGLVLILNDTYGMNKQREWVQTVFGVSDEITHRIDEMGMLVKHYNPTP